jgi:hypothetical protein
MFGKKKVSVDTSKQPDLSNPVLIRGNFREFSTGVNYPLESRPIEFQEKVLAFINERNVQAPAVIEKMEEFFQTDWDNFSIKATRVSDFLIMEVSRFTDFDEKGIPVIAKQNECVNLNLVKSIIRYEGTPIRSDTSVHISGIDQELFDCNYNHISRPDIFITDGDKFKGTFRPTRFEYGFSITLSDTSFATQEYSNDDRLVFEGVGKTLFMPFGMIEPVFGIIMKAISDGHANKDIVIKVS